MARPVPVPFAATPPRRRRAPAPRRHAGLLGALILLLAGTVALPAAAQDRVEGDRYQNPRYGVQIEKPPRWHFITASTVIEVARKAAGMPPSGDADPVKAAGFAVIVSKAPVLGREVAPQVVLMVQDLPKPPGDVIEACERLRSGMNDPETVTPTRPVRLEGRPAARLDFKGYVDGALVRATALCTFQDRRAFVVVGQALAAEFDGEALTFDTILRSFRLR
ncbi:MAG: hypothetical protein ACHQKZ_12700 [Solirubrobacterales bacterium]|jgi:hypothetical protein